jgi:hypothetical protein
VPQCRSAALALKLIKTGSFLRLDEASSWSYIDKCANVLSCYHFLF